MQRREAPLQIGADVVADDDDREVDHEKGLTTRAALSITASVSRAARGHSYLASVVGAAARIVARACSSKSARSSARTTPAPSPTGTYSAAGPYDSRATAVSY